MRSALGVAGCIATAVVVWAAWPPAEDLGATALRVFVIAWAVAAIIWVLHMFGRLRDASTLALALGLIIGAGAAAMVEQAASGDMTLVIAAPLLVGLTTEWLRVRKLQSAKPKGQASASVSTPGRSARPSGGRSSA